MKRFIKGMMMALLAAVVLQMPALSAKDSLQAADYADTIALGATGEAADYADTIQYLDPGAPLYLNYCNIAPFRDAVTGFFNVLKGACAPQNAPCPLAPVFDTISELWSTSGINALRTHGVSLKDNDEFYTLKSFFKVDRAALKNPGNWGFRMLGMDGKAGDLTALNRMPANVSLAFAMKFDSVVLWNLITDIVAKNNAKAQFDEFIAQEKKEEGIDVPAVAKSISGIAFYLTSPVSAPGAPPQTQILPGVASFTLALETKNTLLFDAILKGVRKECPQYIVNGRCVLPSGDANMTIFQLGKMLYVTSDAKSVEFLDKAGADFLAGNKVFRKYTGHIPSKTTLQWLYVSPEFGKFTLPVFSAILQQMSGIDMSPALKYMQLDKPLYAASGIDADGIWSIANIGSRPLAMVLVQPSIAFPLLPLMIAPAIGKIMQSVQGMDSCDMDMDVDEEEDGISAAPAEPAPAPAVPAPAPAPAQ